MHGFGRIGQDLAMLTFHQYWLRMAQAGEAPGLGAYSIKPDDGAQRALHAR